MTKGVQNCIFYTTSNWRSYGWSTTSAPENWRKSKVPQRYFKPHLHRIISVHRVPHKTMQHRTTPSVTNSPYPRTQTNPISWI